MKAIFVFFLFILGQNIFSQEGALKLRVSGTQKPLCKVDSVLFRSNDTLLVLSAGSHRIRIWEYHTSLIDTTVSIRENDTLKCSFRQEISPLYRRHLKNASNYRSLKNQRIFVSPLLVAATVGLGFYIRTNYAQKHYDLALLAKDKYSSISGQAGLDAQKDEFEKQRKKYKTFKACEYSAYGLSAALVANYIRILRKQSRIAAPVWKETPALSALKFDLYPGILDGSVNCRIAWTLK
jgi:hypothetical protein